MTEMFFTPGAGLEYKTPKAPFFIAPVQPSALLAEAIARTEIAAINQAADFGGMDMVSACRRIVRALQSIDAVGWQEMFQGRGIDA